MKTLFLVLLFILISVNTFAASIFINPTSGNDVTGNGTQGNPYKTLGKVGAVLNSTYCDTIYIMGQYHYGVKDEIYRNDAQTHWIYIRPYNNPTVTLDGLGSTPDSWKAILGVQSSKYIDIKNIIVTRNDSASGIRVVSDDVSHNRISQFVNIRNCRAFNCRRQGILIQAKDVLVENCEIDSVCLRNRFGGVGNQGWDFALGTYLEPVSLQSCQNVTFRNNYVHNVWGEGIVVERARNFIIEDNRVSDCFSVCIYSDNSRYGVIQRNWLSVNGEYYNRVYDPSYSARASGIFWASENNHPQDSIVRNIDICNNLICSTGTALGWFDDTSNPSIYDSYRKINIYYNTIFSIKSYMVFYIDTLNVNPNRILPDSCNFKNNIVCRPKWNNQYERYFTYSNDFNFAWTISNNCFIHGSSGFSNNITGQPSFMDSTVNNPEGFRISASSICRDAGTPVPQYTTDFWGAGRDNTPCIGIHEYGGVGSVIQIGNNIPDGIFLSQNYPNPFNPITQIEFAIPNNSALVKLSVYDVSGEEVSVIVNQVLESGTYRAEWNGSNLASGIYLYVLKVNNEIITKKMILTK